MPANNTPATSYPRMTLHCTRCGNEFTVSVLRLMNRQAVDCQVCGQQFPEEEGHKFASALYEMFKVKHNLEESGAEFELAFVYKSTFKQPPAPYAFSPDDFESD